MHRKSSVKVKFKKKNCVKALQHVFSMKHILFLLISVFLLGCTSQNKTEAKIDSIQVDIEVIRFDDIFGTATIANLPELKRKYPNFFPKQYHDSIWQLRMEDTLQQQLYREVKTIFPDEEYLHNELIPLFQHIQYYFPEIMTPRVFTSTSDVDYKNKVILSEGLLIISIDTYLGATHPFYEGIPKYISQNMKKSQLTADIASVYATRLIAVPQQRSFLAQMIYYGKELYLKDLWLSSLVDAEKIGYTKNEMSWAEENETEIWRNFVENELLFSTAPKLSARFINPAPFSKFYLEIDNDSPGMIGRFIGWQIVRSYMAKNPVNVQQLMIKEADEIFKKSKYKPKK